MQSNKVYIILCEGDSEFAYLQELNRFLRENNYSLTFSAKIIGTGYYKNVLQKYSNEKKNNPRLPIKTLLDNDIYCRNDRENKVNFEKSKIKEHFLFNIQNFEDFLILHYDDETLKKWLEICRQNNHEKEPMHSKNYMPQFQKLVPNYSKGSCPFSPLEHINLENLFRHNADINIFIKSDFASLLKNLLNKI